MNKIVFVTLFLTSIIAFANATGGSPCVFEGQTYQDGEFVTFSPFNGFGCIKVICMDGNLAQNGEVTCDDIPANASECDEVPVAGECCPRYENCPSVGGPAKILKCVDLMNKIVFVTLVLTSIIAFANATGGSSCEYQGQTYQDGDFVTYSPFDGFGCQAFYCVDGSFASNEEIECDVPANASECEEVTVAGQCCPRYENCPSVGGPAKILKCVDLV
ncbi:CLUMA_CG018919, isoform A [Clunio marinus]|uniref:CLUMA_CG018919, isoform A n=1 Tax=Clunio marinus TaxID=568069 RepID=A0A1J1J0W7_9DIPT|nr:CLUMA_CG018919, isoform A [Clunio marinus]